jgi:hypothetical protein
MIKGHKMRRRRIDSEAVRTEMPTWQITLLFAMAGCAIVCLLGICRAVEKLVKGILSIRAELTKMNAKLESVEAVKGDDTELEAIEAAVSDFEKLKRIDLTRP